MAPIRAAHLGKLVGHEVEQYRDICGGLLGEPRPDIARRECHRQTVVTIPSDRIELAKLLRGALKGIRNGDCDSGSCSQSALFHVGQFTNLTVRTGASKSASSSSSSKVTVRDSPAIWRLVMNSPI